jgi:hypothetical protein
MIETIVGILIGGVITLLVSRYYYKEAADEQRVVWFALLTAASDTGEVRFETDSKGRITLIQSGTHPGVVVSRKQPWWNRWRWFR